MFTGLLDAVLANSSRVTQCFMIRLHVLKINTNFGVVPLVDKKLYFGRGACNDFVLRSSRLSCKHHCIITTRTNFTSKLINMKVIEIITYFHEDVTFPLMWSNFSLQIWELNSFTEYIYWYVATNRHYNWHTCMNWLLTSHVTQRLNKESQTWQNQFVHYLRCT